MDSSKYQNGKIYKIIDIGYSKCYIGSTWEKLNSRMSHHRYRYRNKTGQTSSAILFDEFGVENCKIELIEYYPCNNLEELRKREGHYIQNTDCVNKRIAGRTGKDYYNDNIEELREKHRQYGRDNKEYVKEKSRQHYQAKKKTYQERNKKWNDNNKEKRKEYNRSETNKEYQKWYIENRKEHISERGKAYYERKKDEIIKSHKQKITCCCGSIIRKAGKAEHERSNKHQEYLKQQVANTEE